MNTVLPKIVVVLGLLTLAVGGAGCSSTKAKTYRTAGFERPHLEAGGLGVFGITALGGGEYHHSDLVDETLRTELAKRFPGMQFGSLATFRSRFGSNELQRIEDRFSFESGLSAEDWSVFQKLEDQPRFLLWIDFNGDESGTYISRSEDTSQEQEYNPTTKKYEDVTQVTGYRTTTFATRTLMLDAFILDRETGREVWRTRIKGTGGYSRSVVNRRSYPDLPMMAVPATLGIACDMAERIVRELPR